MKNHEMIDHMFHLQEELNIRIKGTHWRDLNLDWCRAIWTECGEAMGYIDWKWWAKAENNIIMTKLELTDIWHFGMSWYLQRNITPHIQDCAWPGKTDVEVLEFIASQAITRCGFPIDTFLMLCERMGMDVPGLYKLYVGKQVLNRFRQDHGYNKGTYQKIWAVGTCIDEDNVHMYHMVKELDAENVGAQLYDKLDKMYHG